MGVTENSSSRLIRGLVVLALLFFALAAGRGVSQASAADEPFSITFDKSNIQMGLLADLPLDSVASGASLEGTIDEAGKVTIPKGSFKMPELGIDEPVKVRGFMGIESPATGTFDRSTGQLELDAKAGIWMSVDAAALLDLAGVDLGDLLGGGSFGGINIGAALGPLLNNLTCGFSPMDVHFTTESNSLSNGTRFADGPTGTGAITAEWSQLGPFSGRTKILGLIDPCQLIVQQLPGLLEGGLGGTLPGGIDLGGLDLAGLLSNLNDLDLGPSAITLTKTKVDPIVEEPIDDPKPGAGKAKLKLTVTPKKRKVRPGRATVFTVKVRNVGKASAKRVRVCLTGPGVGLLVRWRCRKFGAVAAGKTKVGRLKVRVKRNAPRRGAKFRFRLKSASTPTQSSRSRLLIRR